ncbi:MAG: SAM-dependent DNA methyltransferase [Bacteroidetes bacterium]|nr:SAM-dependent DNA methyltransferase [Bacteroidota bacterium]
MAPSNKRTHSASESTFSKAILSIANQFSLHSVFDDFLTMTIAACTQNPFTKKSYYEEEYLATIGKYKESELRHQFPIAFAALIEEMEARVDSLDGNDVLGQFFETHISNGRNGQYFTPTHICDMMAQMIIGEASENTNQNRPIRILDPSCGSGRMLLAAHKISQLPHECFGIDIDLTCVKMSAINLFLNGIKGEVMCANALAPNDFVFAYRISFLPLGIFKIQTKENSVLWRSSKFIKEISVAETKGSSPKLFTDAPNGNSTQLDLF